MVGVDAVFFEVNRDPKLFELAGRFKTILCVPGKPRQRFYDYPVEPMSPGIVHHAVELSPLLGAGFCDSLVCVYLRQHLIGTALEQFPIVSVLRRERVKLIVTVTRYSYVCRYPCDLAGLDLRLNFGYYH